MVGGQPAGGCFTFLFFFLYGGQFPGPPYRFLEPGPYGYPPQRPGPPCFLEHRVDYRVPGQRVDDLRVRDVGEVGLALVVADAHLSKEQHISLGEAGHVGLYAPQRDLDHLVGVVHDANGALVLAFPAPQRDRVNMPLVRDYANQVDDLIGCVLLDVRDGHELDACSNGPVVSDRQDLRVLVEIDLVLVFGVVDSTPSAYGRVRSSRGVLLPGDADRRGDDVLWCLRDDVL